MHSPKENGNMEKYLVEKEKHVFDIISLSKHLYLKSSLVSMRLSYSSPFILQCDPYAIVTRLIYSVLKQISSII